MTGWRAIHWVARRELVERARDRSFLISTAITLVILAAVIVLPRLFGAGEAPTYDVGVVGAASEPVGRLVEQRAPATDVKVRVRQVADRADAERQLAEERLDVAIVDGGELMVKQELPADLGALVQAASGAVRAEENLTEVGVNAARARSALEPAPLPVRALEPDDPRREANRRIAFVGVVLVYGQLIGYGLWVASGVVEEKATRVIEVLLATVRPVWLLAGKVIGIGLLAFGQMLLVTLIAVALAVTVGAIELPAATLGTIALLLLWFVLGYAFYSCAFAVAGSTVPRQEELQNSTTPLNLLILAAFFLGFNALQNPDSLLAKVTSYLPPTAPLVMPPRAASGEAAAWEVAVSVLLMVAASVALVPLAARLYTGSVLRTGSKVKLREAWAAARG